MATPEGRNLGTEDVRLVTREELDALTKGLPGEFDDPESAMHAALESITPRVYDEIDPDGRFIDKMPEGTPVDTGPPTVEMPLLGGPCLW